MKFFSVDGPLYKFFVKIWDMLKLNFILLVFCIPIVTVGPALVAAYDVGLKLVSDREGYVIRDFVKAFFSNFKQGFVLGIMNLAAVYALYMDFQLFEKAEGNPVIFLIIGIVGAFLVVLGTLYTYPIIARYENTLVKSIVNAIKVACRYIFGTIVLIILLAIEIYVFVFIRVEIWPLAIAIGPAVLIVTISSFAWKNFRAIELDPINAEKVEGTYQKGKDYSSDAPHEYTPVYGDDEHIVLLPEEEETAENEPYEDPYDTEESEQDAPDE